MTAAPHRWLRRAWWPRERPLEPSVVDINNMSWHLGTRAGSPRGGGSESGSILVWALVFSVIASAMILSHSSYLSANRREMNVRYEHATLADASARSGLTDALAWYQRQQTQPVSEFAPKLDPESDPPLWDTIDPAIGLVREFEVHGGLWARYEVRKDEVADISSERGVEADGSVWELSSRGYLYRLVDPSKGFDERPNQLLATTGVRTEMRGIAFVPPAQAAVAIEQLGQLELGPNAVLDGGSGPAIAYPQGGLLSILLNPLNILGSPGLVSIINFEAAPESVFSMPLGQLRSLSDLVVEAPTASVVAAGGSGGDGSGPGALLGPLSEPQSGSGGVSGSGSSGSGSSGSGSSGSGSSGRGRLGLRTLVEQLTSLAVPRYAAGTGNGSLRIASRQLVNRAVFAEGPVTIAAGTEITGRALLVIRGDLIGEPTSRVDLEGIVYVTGDAILDGDFQLEGMMVVRGKLRAGHGPGQVRIRYEPGAVATLKQALERYRLSRAVMPVQ